MKTKSFLSIITTLPLALLFTPSHASADAVESELYVHSSRTHGYDAVSGRAVSVPATHRPSSTAPRSARTTTPSKEPRRIYNAETGQYDINPDYHEPRVAPVALNARRGVEPRRIYDLEADNFVPNPAYHEPAPVAAAPRTGEPRRIYDLEKNQFIDNPDYHESTLMAKAGPTGTPEVTAAAHRNAGTFRLATRPMAQRHHSPAAPTHVAAKPHHSTPGKAPKSTLAAS